MKLQRLLKLKSEYLLGLFHKRSEKHHAHLCLQNVIVYAGHSGRKSSLLYQTSKNGVLEILLIVRAPL